MTTQVHVGRSFAGTARDAGIEAARRALDPLPDGKANLLIVFATAGYDQPALIEAIRQQAPGAGLTGCTGEGVISHGDSMEQERAVSVMAIRSETVRFDTFLIENYSGDPAARGAELARQVAELGRDDAFGLLLMPDGLTGNCTDLLDALGAALPVPLAVAGGTAADGMRFQRTWQYGDDRVISDGVAAVLLSGAGTLEYAVSHGCSPIGLERTVTRADRGWIHEIDHRPAWSVFKEYLDGDPEDLNAEGIVHLCIGLPLEGREAESYAPYVIRTPLDLNRKTGAMFFPGGGLHSDQKIQLTRRDPEQIRKSARACAESILGQQPDRKPAFVLQFDCAGRGRILFGACAAEEIVQPLQEILGEETPWIGFHTYGEVAPIDRHLYYHNYTVVLCAVYDAAPEA